jgi:hypothetical protein
MFENGIFSIVSSKTISVIPEFQTLSKPELAAVSNTISFESLPAHSCSGEGKPDQWKEKGVSNGNRLFEDRGMH